MADLSLFGQRIKQLRQNLNLSQRDFAEKIGVTASALSAYEKGQKNPSVGVAINIATEYKVSLDWLCGLKKDSNKFQQDDLINYDLPQALTLLLELIHSELLARHEEGDKDVSHDSVWIDCLTFRNAYLQNFIDDSIQLEMLYATGSISKENFDICQEEMTFRAAESIRKEVRRQMEREEQEFRKMLDRNNGESPF